MSFEKLVPLNEFITLQRGFDLPKGDRIDGEIPVVASTGVGGYHNEAKVEAPGVVIGRSGSIGGGQYITEDFWPLNTTLWVKDFKGHYPRYAYYLLRNIDFTNFNVGGAVPTLNRNHLSSVLVADIGYNNEKKIAKILGELDDKIELNRQTNQTLEHIAQTIFKSWFVDFEPARAKIIAKQKGGNELAQELAAQAVICGAITLHKLAELEGGVLGIEKELHPLITKRFPNEGGLDLWQPQQLAAIAALFPNSLVDSELGDVPEGWAWSEIGDEVTVVGGGTPSTKNIDFWEGGNIHWTTPKDMSNLADKVLLETGRKITKAGLAKISSGLLPKETVLMSSRAPVGYLAIAKVPLAINQGYIAMKCDAELSPEYVVQWAELVMDEIKQRASGTTFAEISKKNFKVIPIVVPNEKVMGEYTKITSAFYSKITEGVREINELTDIRDALLPKFLSGELTTVATQEANHV
jgi:type I restriction enzyme S subunit